MIEFMLAVFLGAATVLIAGIGALMLIEAVDRFRGRS
jgi:hypothetical protein